MYSSDRVKHFIIGITHSISNTSDQICLPGGTTIYTSVHRHLDWIGHLIGDERCISNAMDWQPKKLLAHLQAIALATLSASLVVYLMVNEMNLKSKHFRPKY